MGRKKKPTQEQKLEISAWTEKGHGLGVYRDSSGTSHEVEVPYTLPGDVAQVAFRYKRQGRYEGRLLELLAPGKQRISSRCAHFGECGGCRLQHLSYEDQLKKKERDIHREFQDLLEGSQSPLTLEPIVPCDPPWEYRNKMEFAFSENRSGKRFLGLKRAGGDVIDLHECHLAAPWFTQVLEAVKGWWESSGLHAYHYKTDEGALRLLTLREGKRTGRRLAMLTVSGNAAYPVSKAQLDSFTQTVGEAAGAETAIFLRIHQIKKGHPTQFYEWKLQGPDFLQETLNVGNETLTFHVSPSAFFQPNTLQAEKIYAKALAMADLKADDVVFDLYCGTGTLGILAAKKARRVIGIELSPEASLDARENAKHNGIENFEVLTGDVGLTLTRLKAEGKLPEPDCLMVDPPRIGLDKKAMENLFALAPKKILYISCNPSTQAMNARELVSQGYRLRALCPIDQFPHTLHVENLCLFERSSQ